MTWVSCPFCRGEGSKGIVPVMCTEDEFLYLNYLAKKNSTEIDSIFVQMVRDHIQKKFPEWKPYHPLDHKPGDKGLKEIDGELVLEERK